MGNWTKIFGPTTLGRYGAKNIFLVRKNVPDDVDELSQSDLDILESVWHKFGWMNASQVRNWTHLHCPEYTDIASGRLPIDYAQISRALQIDDPGEISDYVNEYRSIEAAFAKE
jgi:hypothetical protein